MKIIYRWTLTILIGLNWTHPARAGRDVSVERFEDIAFAKSIQYPASVINLQVANIAAETSGRITHFPALVGDEVKKGQVIIKLDCSAAKTNLLRIKAGIKRLTAKRQLTEQQLERAKRLNRTNSISREELDQRETQLVADNAGIEEQQALLEAARQSVGYCQIKAPFSGIIIQKMSTTGAYATPGVTQFKLLMPDAVEVRIELPPFRIQQLTQAKVIFYHSTGSSYELKIRRVLPIVDDISKLQVVHLTIIPTARPPGGSYGVVKFDSKSHFIASRYIQKRAGQFGVFIVHNGRARFKPLAAAEEGQSVASTLPPDTLIINNQLQLLNDNEKITVQP